MTLFITDSHYGGDDQGGISCRSQARALLTPWHPGLASKDKPPELYTVARLPVAPRRLIMASLLEASFEACNSVTRRGRADGSFLMSVLRRRKTGRTHTSSQDLSCVPKESSPGGLIGTRVNIAAV